MRDEFSSAKVEVEIGEIPAQLHGTPDRKRKFVAGSGAIKESKGNNESKANTIEMDNNPDNNPERQHDLDERRQLRRRITVTRPRAPLDEPHHELGRSSILYLLRVAPLTRRNDGGRVELTATGAHFGIQHRLRRYTDKYAAKFGYTEEPAQTRFDLFVTHCLQTGCPEWLDPVFELAIIGIPPELLQQMEHGLRNFLEREEVRMRLHSRKTFRLPGNSNIFTERHEFVCTDEQRDRLFDLYDTFAIEDGGVALLLFGRRTFFDVKRSKPAQLRCALSIAESTMKGGTNTTALNNRNCNKLDSQTTLFARHWVLPAGYTSLLCKVWWLRSSLISREWSATRRGLTSGAF